MRIAFVWMCAFVTVLSGCKPKKEYSSYGDSVIMTSVRWEQEVDIAMVEVHSAMANWTIKADGTKSDPTYQAGSRNWKNSEGEKYGVSRLEFTTQDGHVNTMKTICISDKDLVLILCESTDAAARLSLCRQVAAVLNARGFRREN